jgi:hypothetical protein
MTQTGLKCSPYLFYQVYVNSTYTQANMTSATEGLLGILKTVASKN